MQSSPPASPTGLEGVSVLVIDDSPVIRELMAAILYGLGIRAIFEASSGAEGLEIFRDRNPDIIFADWTMEPIDGAEFVQFIRKGSDSPNPHVPIIMMTGHSEEPRVRKARELGVTEFLAKPVSIRAVAERIEAVIHRPRPFVRTGAYFGPDRRRKVASFDGVDKRGKDGEAGSMGFDSTQTLAGKATDAE